MKANWNRLLRPKALGAGAVVVSVLGAVAFALTREPQRVAPATTAQKAVQPPRPALTAAEEQYIRKLWPIHGDVQRSAMRLSLGQIFYKTQDLSRDELNARVEEAIATFQSAEKQLRALEPPATLRSDHDEYLAAVQLFKESAGDVRKMFTDGREDWLLAAYPKSLEGSNKIRDVGGKFWPQEFPPH
jgi:hypothetical protein